MSAVYRELEWYRDRILSLSAILAGDEVGPDRDSWQDVARRLADDLRMYAVVLEAAANGKLGGGIVFPSWEGGAE